MNQRTVVIALVFICLVTVVGWVGLRDGAGAQKTSERASDPPGCFDIKVNPVVARHTYLVNRCTGEAWQIQRGPDDALSWMPLRRYPTSLLDLFEGTGSE